jgi:hypothetical protein
MQDQNTKAIEALQIAKQNGLSRYDAIQSLRAQGFDQSVIDDATDHYYYQQGVVSAPGVQPLGATSDEAVTEKQKLDDELEEEDAQLRKDRLNEKFEEFRRI